jgi:predicted nucleic acid-binding protein
MERQPLIRRLPKSVLLDSSVVLKWFRKNEAWRDVALQIRKAYLDGHLVIYVPDLLIYEIANVLRYKPDLIPAQIRELVASLFGMQIKIVEISLEVIGRAVDLAYAYEITVYDAAFVAMAEQLRIDFISSDEKLIQKLGSLPYVHNLGNLA